MADSKHKPAATAPAKEWVAYLKGRGYVRSTGVKPVTNYKDFHGYWVPPRLGSVGKPAASKARAKLAPGDKPDRAWYSKKTLTTLYRTDRATFDKLVERVGDIKQLVADQENAERLAEHRALLEPAVEAGLLNQAEADRKLAAWAKTQGITIPKA